MGKRWWILILILWPSAALADPPGFSLSLGGTASKSYAPVPLRPNGGFGVIGGVEYGFSNWFSGGLSGGLVEFISPPGDEDMKTAWLDLTGRFFPLADSPLGRPYWELGFGISPFIAGVYSDYWPDYAAAKLGQPLRAGVVYWNTQTSVGYRFHLGPQWALDTEVQYNVFWPPSDLVLQTLGFDARLVWFFGK
jgi:hypothetical protein